MAQIGSVPAASRYDGLTSGPRLAYMFETQSGIPIDGTNALLRELSPFNLRLIVPDALLEMAASGDTEAVDLIDAAALGSETGGIATEVSTALATVTVGGGSSNPNAVTLEQFVSVGQFYAGSTDTFVSTLADAFQAADIALQLQTILNAPPLTLLVNPTEMSIQYTKVQSYQSRTRQGYVFETWGEEQPTISFSGTTAGFVAGTADQSNPFGGATSGQTSSVSGYQAAARRDSASWQNFMSLYLFYKNNGYIYDTIRKSEAHLFVGAVAIDYDQWTYVGHIESFSYRFEEDSPLKVSFDMEFRVSRRYDRAVSAGTVVPQTSPTTSTSRTALFGGSSTSLDYGNARGSTSTGVVADIPLDLLGDF